MNVGRRRVLLAACAALSSHEVHEACAAAEATEQNLRRLRLGDLAVAIRTTRIGSGGLTFVHLHENEQTSVQAARDVLAGRRGRLIELRSRGQRLVPFRIGQVAYQFDPNRIFTDSGLEATLRRYGPYSAEAHDAVRELRNALLEAWVGAEGPLVALHNNAGRDYTLRAYEAGAPLAREAERIARVQRDADEDFFVVTRPELIEPLVREGFNVVLQSGDARDDGSLSVWAQRRGLPYINVEARHGRLAKQRLMLQAVLRLFD